MIGTSALKPYEGYVFYKTFNRKIGRYFAVLVSKGHRTAILYSRYVLEVHLGRRIKKGYDVHHKDENKTNDTLCNLEEKLASVHRSAHGQKPIRHGTAAGYRRGCRCSNCWEGQRLSNLKWKEKKLSNISSIG